MTYQWHVKPWVVKLEDDEIQFATHVARCRSDWAAGNGLNGKHGAAASGSEAGRSLDAIGSMAEIAAAKALNLYWYPMVGHNPEQIDVGGLFEVRSTQHMHGCLIIHQDDRDWLPYILVLAQPPWFKLAGYMMGGDAKQEKFVDMGKLRNAGSWMVPQEFLTPMDEIVFRRVSEKQMS